MFKFSQFPFGNEPELEESDIKELQERLFLLMKEAYQQKIAFVFIIEGWASSGKGDLLKTLTVRLDPRKFKVYSPYVDTSEDRGYPFLWNFWKMLPRFGETLFYLNSYYGRLVYLWSEEKIEEGEFYRRMISIQNTERILTRDNVHFYKFFLHVSEKEQNKRLKKAKAENKKWQVSQADKLQTKHYSRYKKAFERVISESDSAFAPWTILSAENNDSAKAALLHAIISGLENDLKVNSKEQIKLLAQGQELMP